MAQLPVYNPPSPFLGFLPAGLGLYRKVIIRGKMKEDQFNINFQSGPNVDPRDDCPLHISIRPRDKLIVRNTYQFRSWGIEERHGGCPIQKKGYFDVQVTVKPDAYSIAINGCQYADFAHRQPYASVRFIHISEGAQIDAMITE
ncbi:32 kDa beta-galactoside-binding lectin-like [Malaya genurostris]|uniref:32 kDa beta-galactoside-binding lectin-like n=1 Tax=Malaya genurostris TaxID=325434 RepID=UPI0026F3861E|nr:32 kDa beta-galactoside-binding lectin-like [Malaya genurostris]